MLAKAGLKEDREQNEWIIDLFINRQPDTAIVYTVLRSLSDIEKNGGDLTFLGARPRRE